MRLHQLPAGAGTGRSSGARLVARLAFDTRNGCLLLRLLPGQSGEHQGMATGRDTIVHEICGLVCPERMVMGNLMQNKSNVFCMKMFGDLFQEKIW